MSILLYLAAAVAVVSTVMVITRLNAVHALLYLVVSLLAVALVFFLLGAPFVAVLEVIVYAGAIMVLFVFVVVMFNLGSTSIDHERMIFQGTVWVLPGLLALLLLVEFAYLILVPPAANFGVAMVGPGQVGIELFTRYGLAIELVSFVLLSGLVGAYHIGRRYAAAPGGSAR
ncbi:MAG: NADH-quinone oxidoreductase subunit J [Armatimonadota bacterium]